MSSCENHSNNNQYKSTYQTDYNSRADYSLRSNGYGGKSCSCSERSSSEGGHNFEAEKPQCIRGDFNGLRDAKAASRGGNVLHERIENEQWKKAAQPSSTENAQHAFAGKENDNCVTCSSSQQRKSTKQSRSLEDIMEPLNVRRLRPIRQKTRNVVLSILEDESVCLEFIKSKGNAVYVMEVFRITCDGIKVTSYCPNGKIGVPLTQAPPETLNSAVSYAFSGLPQRLWKKYQYADKFVRLVRMKSPKVSCIALSLNLKDNKFGIYLIK